MTLIDSIGENPSARSCARIESHSSARVLTAELYVRVSPRLSGQRRAGSGGEQMSATQRVGVVERVARQEVEVHDDRAIVV